MQRAIGSCPICLSNIEPSDESFIAHCLHSFCFSVSRCIDFRGFLSFQLPDFSMWCFAVHCQMDESSASEEFTDYVSHLSAAIHGSDI